MSDVFISYKAEDRRRVKPLVQAMQTNGFSVWWDEHIGAGDDWRDTIEKQLDAARCVLVVWSKRSVGPEGRFVRDEASRAQLRRAYVPVLIDAVKPPLGFGECQAMSLRGWRGDSSDPRCQAVLAAVGRVVGRQGNDGGAHTPTATAISRRAMLGGGAVVAATAAGVSGWMLLKPSAAAASDKIAVLPFANLSGDPGQTYFSDGIAEELRSALARLAGLKVVGRTSSEAVRDDDAETAARKLNVPNVLTGSVRRSPATIRVSAQLIDGASGIERWSRSYDRPPGDTIRIQTEIAESVASAMSVTLGSAARAALIVGGTENAAAQNLVLQATDLTKVFERDKWQRALKLLDAALALDPNYARAYGLKAIVISILSNRYSRSAGDLARGRQAALRNAHTAVKIAPRLPLGYGVLAEIYRSNLQIAEAGLQHTRAMQLGSVDPDEIRSYAGFLSAVGRSGEALRLTDQALALDPLNPGSYASRARILYNARRYTEVVDSAAGLKRNSPELYDFPITLGDALVMLGRFDQARKVYAEEAEDDPIRLAAEGVAAARAGDRATAVSTLARIDRLYGEAASYQFAEIHASLGDVEQAFSALDRGWHIKDPGLFGMKIDPWLDPLRNDPRFAALMRKIGFPA
jgi:serine/threonine-protein kinase